MTTPRTIVPRSMRGSARDGAMGSVGRRRQGLGPAREMVTTRCRER